MINVADLARRLSTAVGRPPGGAGLRLKADDVLGYLHGRSDAFELEHGAAAVERVDAALATLPRLIVEERLPKQHPGFVRYFEATPRIVFMTGRGYSSEEIANSMNFLATEYGIEAVLHIVADAVAKRLRKG